MTCTPPAGPSISETRRSQVLWFAFLGAAAIVWAFIYAPVRHFDFLNFDDNLFVSGNPWLRHGFTWDSVTWALTANLTGYSQNAEYWSPLTLLSRLADAELFGMQPGAFHVSSAVIHLLNAALLGAALFRLTGARWRSGAVAMLFLVHPLNVEPVCWLSARKDLLGATFTFVTFLAYAHFAARRNLGRYALFVASFCAALMAKPMAVTVPLLLLLLDWWPLHRWQGCGQAPSRWPGLLLEKLPVFLLAAGGAVLAVVSQRDWGAMQSADEFPLAVRLNNAVVSYAVYLRRIFWPNDLTIYYPHPGRSLPFAHGMVAAAILILVSLAAFALARRAPYFLAGWIWFGVVLGPVIGLVQIGNQAMADRYAYPSAIGIFIAIVWGAASLLQHRLQFAAWSGALTIAALSWVSARQVLTWQNSETVFTRALSVTSNNDLAHLNLGNVYFVRGDYASAREQYLRSVAIKPKQFRVWNNLGVVESKLGRQDEAIRDYREALALNPAERKSRMALARILIPLGQTQEAEALLKDAVEAEPDWSEPYAELGKLYRTQGRFAQATALWSAYLLRHPDDAAAREALNAASNDVRK